MKKQVLAIVALMFSHPIGAFIADEDRGRDIVLEVDRRDTGFGDTHANVTMLLKNRNGDESLRLLEIKTLEVTGDGDKSLTLFDTPRDIKGTAFLSFTHALIQDEQWLYLPALKRVKRISSANKSGPFLGSEYAFEDLTSYEIDKYSYRYLSNEIWAGIECFVVEMTPQYEFSGYSRTLAWIDKDRYILLKIEYYDRKNALLKTQVFKNHKQYLQQYWRADEQIMTNHQNGKVTQLKWQNYRFRNGFTDRDFDRSSLKRAR